MPRPLTTLALERFEAATLGCQLASFAAFTRTFFQRCGGSSVRFATFCRRNTTGSILAMYASSSTACSAANADCGLSGARRNDTLKYLFCSGRLFPITRQFGIEYCAPLIVVSARPAVANCAWLPCTCC